MYYFPFIVEPSDSADAEPLVEKLRGDRAYFNKLLDEYGVLLFRGYHVANADEFEAASMLLVDQLQHYTGGGSPRSIVKNKVYTSTEYPPDQHIPLHCEETYFPDPPRHLFFYCESEPASDGQTPIGHMGKLLETLDDAIIDKFDELGVHYIYNLHGGDGFGRGWKDAFLTDDREQVTDWLDQHQCEYQWQENDLLSMQLQGPGLRTHPVSGEKVWGNQAVNWHIDALPEKLAATMKRLYPSEADYPKHATFGDGQPIPIAEIRRIMEALREIEVTFDWQQGDVLWCDNHKVAHGRRPFTGNRRILVTMA